MTVRIYAALTIAMACGLGACSTAPGTAEIASSASSPTLSEGNAKPPGKSGSEPSTAKPADVTGSIPPSKLLAAGRRPQQQKGTEEARLPDESKAIIRKLDEPLYRPPATQMSEPQRSSLEPGVRNLGNSSDPAAVVAPASVSNAPARAVVVASAQPNSDRPDSINLSYQTDAVELSEKDRRNVMGFVAHRASKDPITVVTGPSIGANPLEGLLRVQERGRRLGELLATHGSVEVRFEPDLPRDSVRID